MPAAEFQEWLEFYEIEPWGLSVHDAFHAHAIAVQLNMNRDPKTRPEPFSIDELRLFPEPKPDVPEPTVDGLTAAQWRLKFDLDRLEYQQKQQRVQQ